MKFFEMKPKLSDGTWEQYVTVSWKENENVFT